MTKTTNITDFKEKRKIKKIIEDLEKVETLLQLILKGLAVYKKYKPVRDILQNVLENKAAINAFLKSYKELLAKKNDKLEEVGQ